MLPISSSHLFPPASYLPLPPHPPTRAPPASPPLGVAASPSQTIAQSEAADRPHATSPSTPMHAPQPLAPSDRPAEPTTQNQRVSADQGGTKHAAPPSFVGDVRVFPHVVSRLALGAAAVCVLVPVFMFVFVCSYPCPSSSPDGLSRKYHLHVSPSAATPITSSTERPIPQSPSLAQSPTQSKGG